jgi:hypothetical protein
MTVMDESSCASAFIATRSACRAGDRFRMHPCFLSSYLPHESYLYQTFALALVVGLSPVAVSANTLATAAEVVSKPGISGTAPWAYESVPNWGNPKRADFPGPTHGGIAISDSGLIYASTDNAKGILVFQPDGTLLKTIAPECRGSHALVWREENGKEYLYAAHLHGNRVVKLTTED